MNINELKCPDCDQRMVVMYYNEDYCRHACMNCKMFHKLGNPEDYEGSKSPITQNMDIKN